MIKIRKANERGQGDHGWLHTNHTFSFADYHDAEYMGFRSLRVINEDVVESGQGFGTHPHRDMEIVTYVLAGALEHKDSMGNGQVLRPGEFQRMSAGTGITHSEFNPSSTQPVHLYQIWIKPGRKGITPSYEQKHFDEASSCNQLQLVASPGGDSGSLMIHQDVHIYLMNLEKGKQFTMNITPERHVWLQVLHGEVTLNGEKLSASDGAAVSEEALLSMETALDAEAELLLFDLA